MTPIQLAQLLREAPQVPNPLLAKPSPDDAPYQVWLTNLDGYIVLNWNAPVEGASDFVALYAPGADINNPKAYMTRQWQYASKGSPYQTGTYSNPGYIGVYWSYDANKGYQKLAFSDPSH
jgi:hypothetical protein